MLPPDAPRDARAASGGYTATTVATEHRALIAAAQFSPDGRLLGVAYSKATVFRFDPDAGSLSFDAPVRLAGQHKAGLNALAFSADARQILTASDDTTARLWDAATGAGTLSLAGHAAWVTGCDLAPDGAVAVTCGYEGAVRVWDARTGACTHTLSASPDPVSAARVVIAPDKIIAASFDGKARVWDTRFGHVVQTILPEPVGGTLPACADVAVAPNRRYFLVSWLGSCMRIWDQKERRFISAYEGAHALKEFPAAAGFGAAAWGNSVFSGGERGAAAVYSLNRPAQSFLLPHAEPAPAPRPGAGPVGVMSSLQDIQDADTAGSQRAVAVTAVACEPRSRVFATGGTDSVLKLWTPRRAAEEMGEE